MTRSLPLPVITVLIGGIAATLITGIIQWRAGVREFEQGKIAREREFEQAWLKSCGDQALESYKEYLEQEQQLMRRAYALIGTCTSASDKLAGLTRGVWRQRFTGEQRTIVDKQMNAIRTTSIRRTGSGKQNQPSFLQGNSQ